MINQTMLVGRVVREPEVRETENGKKVTNVTLAVSRSFKNADGEYETDFIDCTLWSGVAENTAEYCRAGDIIGIRGRIQTRMIENEDGTMTKRQEVVADKVTFLSSAKQKETETNLEEEPVMA